MKQILAAVLVTATACGGGGGGGGGGADGGGGGGGAVTIDTYATAVASAECGHVFQCCTSVELMNLFAGVTVGDGSAELTTEQQCDEYEAGLLDAFVVPEQEASVAAGRAMFDAQGVVDCLMALNPSTCGGLETIDTASACKHIMVPLVSDAAACTQSYECTSGNCEGATEGSDGACQPIPELGSACDLVCDAGLYCGIDHSLNNVCMAQGDVGAPCTNGHQCTSGSCVGSGSDDQTDRMCADPSMTCVGS